MKTPRGQEQCHINEYMLGHLLEQEKWATGALIWRPLEFCIFAKRLFYKNPRSLFFRARRCSQRQWSKDLPVFQCTCFTKTLGLCFSEPGDVLKKQWSKDVLYKTPRSLFFRALVVFSKTMVQEPPRLDNYVWGHSAHRMLYTIPFLRLAGTGS